LKIRIDNVGYTNKPENYYEINNRLANMTATNIELESFCELVGKQGHAFCISDFYGTKRCRREWKSQQIFALDFDNTIKYDKFPNVRNAMDYP